VRVGKGRDREGMGRKGKGKERERGGEGLRYGCSGMDAPVRCYRKELTFNYLYILNFFANQTIFSHDRSAPHQSSWVIWVYHVNVIRN